MRQARGGLWPGWPLYQGRRAEAQALLPIEYTAFVWAAIMGWWMFAEPVTLATLLGVALIVIGCWIAAPRAHIEETAL